MADEPSVHLLRPWRVDIFGAEASFDVGYRNFVVERRQGPGESRRRVALHDDPIRPEDVEYSSDSRQRRSGQIRQVLIRAHNRQIPIGM